MDPITRTLDDLRESVTAVVADNWEAADLAYHALPVEQREGHVYEHLARLDRWLGTTRHLCVAASEV